ncbi:HERV-H LTR-associating protein 1 [Dipodomys merriami]|uniref:HERV-H LTR-associating protein 1 n=1 Tax=Dipodomys merriami TaxID=94247 RepID=UPI003855C6F5
MLRLPVHGPPVRLFVGLACVLTLSSAVSGPRGEDKQEKGMTFLPAAVSVLKEEKKEEAMTFLATTELPAKSVDLSALNLTELVNGMLSRALKESKKFFSLLTVTSYSSFAFHKVSIAIYNISNPKTVDPATFPTRYCYCLNNRTNDLSDFTALLVDIIGNSTSYLTEIFKSTSILSVSQTNDSDCIFICVMAGRSGRNLSDFWEMAERSPVLNYTFTSSVAVAGVLGAATRKATETSRLTTQSQQTLPEASPPNWTQSSHWESAPRTFLWAETSSPSEREVEGNTVRLIPSTATQRDPSHTRSTSASGKVTRTPWVTASRQTWASTLSVPRAQTTNEKTPGGPPWKTHTPTFTSPPEAQEAIDFAEIWAVPSKVARPSPDSGSATPGTRTPSPTKAPAPRDPQMDDVPARWPLTPGEEAALIPAPHRVSRCPRLPLKEGSITAAPLPMVIRKLNPCLMELCRYFQQCLCVSQMRDSSSETMRYCLEFYSWFLKNATLICGRVKRVSHSHTLKQKCLENVCKSV